MDVRSSTNTFDVLALHLLLQPDRGPTYQMHNRSFGLTQNPKLPVKSALVGRLAVDIHVASTILGNACDGPTVDTQNIAQGIRQL